jgi:PAS domain S-box-containing protein
MTWGSGADGVNVSLRLPLPSRRREASRPPAVLPVGGSDFELIADSIPHMVWTAAPDGTTDYFNHCVALFTGLPVETNHGWGWLSLIHPEDADRARREWEQASAAETELATEWRVRRADDQYRWLAIRGVPIRDAAGSLSKWVGICTDIDDPKRLEAELRRSEQETAESLTLLKALQASAPVGFAFIDREFRIVHINETLAAVNGGAIEDQIGRAVAEVVPEIWPELEVAYRQVLETGSPIVDREIVGPSAAAGGELRHWLNSFHPVRINGEIVGIGVVVFDITERKRAEDFRSAVMAQMAEGVYALDGKGRLLFMNAAASTMLGWTEDELRGKSMHEVVHYQHADGTPFPGNKCELLQVRTQGKAARVVDDAFTRKDGSIFPAAYSAAPLLDATSGVHGVVVVFRDATEETADRTRVQRELAALAWVGRIRDALDEQRFVLYSQPIVPLAGGEQREELLLRMLGHDGDLIPPQSFLPIAEKYGLIGEIDRWVIAQSVQLAATGRRVHVNLSADSIAHLDLLPLIDHELLAAGADPANLVFEITETALMGDVDAGETFAHGLVAFGCGIALDDFGTGFGSFTYLKRLAITYLKIDVDFVRDLATNRANQHLVKAIVGLAQGFGVETIAEGVEDEQTLELLREFGVDYAQGFHFGHPSPLTEAGLDARTAPTGPESPREAPP